MGPEAGAVPLTALFRAGDLPMHAVLSIAHGMFLLLRKVCWRGSSSLCLFVMVDKRSLHSAAVSAL